MAELLDRQRKAMRTAKELGLQLRDRFPAIADDYRRGRTLREIVYEYRIAQRYHVTMRIAIGAVSLAIRGNIGGLGISSYDGLISDGSELEALCSEHRNKPLRCSTREDLSRYGKKGGHKGGLMGGATNKREKTGICGMTREEVREAGRKSAEARGYVPWTNPNDDTPEIEYAYLSSQNKIFMIGSRINHIALTQRLNEVYHNSRTPETVKAALQRYANSQRVSI